MIDRVVMGLGAMPPAPPRTNCSEVLPRELKSEMKCPHWAHKAHCERPQRSTVWRFARALSVGIIVAILACAEADACRVADNIATTFFDEVPEGIDAPIIAQVTIIRIIPETTINLPAGRSFSGLASVKKVVRGELAKRVIRITAPMTSCNFPFSVGASGFVAGTLQWDEQNRPKLLVISESYSERAKRKGASR